LNCFFFYFFELGKYQLPFRHSFFSQKTGKKRKEFSKAKGKCLAAWKIKMKRI
jgi:hypothetical protein